MARPLALPFMLALAARALGQASSPAVLENAAVRVEAWLGEGRLQERYLARAQGAWVAVAKADGTAGPTEVEGADHALPAGSDARVACEGSALVESFSVGGLRVSRRLELVGEGPWIHVDTSMEASAPTMLHAFLDRFGFLYPPDWSFAPSVGGFIPDGQFKAPLILVQHGRIALGLVPDLASLDLAGLRQCNHAMDLDVPHGPLLAVGLVPNRMAYHSVFAEDAARAWPAAPSCRNAYYLLLTADAEPGQAYREAVRFHWRTFGRPAQRSAAGQQMGTDPGFRTLALWDDWRRKVWDGESRERWLSVGLPGGATGGGVLTNRWGPGPSVYLSAWFNTLRTSYGMALYARRTGNAPLLGLAAQTVALAVGAPGRDGAFKCIAVPRPAGAPTLWAAGDGDGASTQAGFLGYDMSWTGYWLLKWHEAGLRGGDGIRERCRALARFLIARQLPDGMVPTRFKEDGSVDLALSRTVKAETGPVVLFLLECYRQDPDPRVLKAALAGMAFLARDVVPLRQWYDFETFWSCSWRTPKFDERTAQWPANDLALSQATEAYLVAYQVTGERHYLADGEALLDYLLLYQQCWTNPSLLNLSGPNMLLGGFTTQNSDAEWSDARQSQIGNFLLDYYRATGKPEYLERGIAALRAQFPISPSENWAHEGYGKKAGVSSFHWGEGSGLAGVEMEDDFLHDAVVDLAAGRGTGVDGLDVTECVVQGDRIQLSIRSPFAWNRQPVVAFLHARPSRSYLLVVNGAAAGTWSGADLEKGVAVAPAPEE